MRVLCATLLLLCLILLLGFWTSHKIESLCNKMLSFCQSDNPSQLFTFWNQNKIWFSFTVNRELLKELEIQLHIWCSCAQSNPSYIGAKQNFTQILTNIRDAYGISFLLAL